MTKASYASGRDSFTFCPSSRSHGLFAPHRLHWRYGVSNPEEPLMQVGVLTA